MTVPNACNFSPRLDAYLDRELSPADREEVETHLAICPECREELADLSRFSRAFRSMEKPAAPIEKWAGINPWADHDATGPIPLRLPSREPNHLWYIRRLSAVAAVLFVVAAGQVVYLKLNPPEPAEHRTIPTSFPHDPHTQPSKSADERS